MPDPRNERESKRAPVAGARGRDWGGAREKCRAERVPSEMCEIERAYKRMRKSWVSAPDVEGSIISSQGAPREERIAHEHRENLKRERGLHGLVQNAR
jgi:hypothetical protein